MLCAVCCVLCAVCCVLCANVALCCIVLAVLLIHPVNRYLIWTTHLLTLQWYVHTIELVAVNSVLDTMLGSAFTTDLCAVNISQPAAMWNALPPQFFSSVLASPPPKSTAYVTSGIPAGDHLPLPLARCLLLVRPALTCGILIGLQRNESKGF